MNELIKPTLQVDLDIQIPKIEPIVHNLDIVEDYALKLKNFYDNIVFDESQYVQAKDERAKVNNLTKKIADNRKEVLKKYKEPISDFEATSKRIETLLSESASVIDSSVKKFDLKQQEIKNTKINTMIEDIREEFINNYPEHILHFQSLPVAFDNRWFNKTYKDKDIISDIKTQFEEKLEDILCFERDVELISEMLSGLDKEYLLNKDIYLERYKFTRDVNEILTNIKEDLAAKQKIEIEDPFAGLSVEVETTTQLISVKLTLTEDKLKLVEKFAKENNIEMERL